jgi:hydroxymethylbilane synthase
MAGLGRLGLDLGIAAAVPLDADEFVPAAGQGSLGLTARDGDARALAVLRSIEHESSRATADAERAAARGLGGSCWVPVGAHACVEGKKIRVTGVVASPDGLRLVRRSETGDVRSADEIGTAVAAAIMAGGGAEIVSALPDLP